MWFSSALRFASAAAELIVITVDSLNNTAADIALSMNNAKIYEHVRNAGIRSGMFLIQCWYLSRLTYFYLKKRCSSPSCRQSPV